MESEYHPGKAKFSYKKFYLNRKLACGSFKERFVFDIKLDMVAHFLKVGDLQPAVVHSVEPLIISAYSDEFDAVVFLEFPDKLADIYALKKDQRLLTVCGYSRSDDKVADDIYSGSESSLEYSDIYPIVVLFWAKDKSISETASTLFDENHWKYVQKLTDEYVLRCDSPPRDGFFYMKKFVSK